MPIPNMQTTCTAKNENRTATARSVNSKVAALFHAEGASFPDQAAVEGVYLDDVEQGCAFTGYDEKPGIDANSGMAGMGDFMARFHIH